MNVSDFYLKKQNGQKISMITCYDFWTAAIIRQSTIDCVLVGDSGAMVMHGFPTTLNATVDLMALHTSAVSRGIGEKFLIADMPFLSFRKGVRAAMLAVEKLVQAGAQAVKLEGVEGHEDVITNIVKSGVPVMGHLGLTPQSIHQIGGFKVQARDVSAQTKLIDHAHRLEDLGCFSVVLECIPAVLAARVTNELNIPTIGIGAGHEVDGQVLVLQDMLGMNDEFSPKFLKKYLNGHRLILDALNSYHSEVVAERFPTEKESYLSGNC